MTPLLFGPPERRLFGLFHEAERSAATDRGESRAVLLCPPFGHEAIRGHRLLRVLAERLARAGQAVLRFDYFGTGDAGGDDDDGELDGWSADIRTAHAELAARSGAARIAWLGVRLGASLAVRAVQPAGPRAQTLLLWDPIVDGSAYLQTLRVKHVDALERRHGLPDPAWRRALEDDPGSFTAEAIGFAITPVLRRQLQAMRPEALDVPAGIALRVLADPGDAAVFAWAAQQRARDGVASAVALRHTLDWTSDPEPRSAIVPPEVVSAVLGQLGAQASAKAPDA